VYSYDVRACLKNAFRKIYVTICGRFCPDEGVVAGYVNRIRAKYTAKWGVQIVEMIFQTRSGERRERNLKTLKEVHVGETVKVQKLTGEGPVKRRIMDMGITKGVEIYVRKVAPLGDPVEVTVRGYELSLRKADAEMIVVE